MQNVKQFLFRNHCIGLIRLPYGYVRQSMTMVNVWFEFRDKSFVDDTIQFKDRTFHNMCACVLSTNWLVYFVFSLPPSIILCVWNTI